MKDFNPKELRISSPALFAEKLLATRQGEEPLSVELKDKYGHSYVGNLMHLDADQNTLFLSSKQSNKGEQVSLINLSSLVSLTLFDSEKHMPKIVGRKLEESDNRLSDDNFVLEDYVEQVERALKDNKDYRIKFEIDYKALNSKLSQQNCKVLVDLSLENLAKVLSEDIGKDLLGEIDTFEIEFTKGKAFSLKKRQSKLLLGIDLDEKLPSRIHTLFTENLEKAL